MVALLPPQPLARTQRFAQFLELLIRNKTATNQTVAMQVGDPSRIADIDLTTRDIFEVSGIRQNNSKLQSLRMFQTGFQ
jgi:hypothetical protein